MSGLLTRDCERQSTKTSRNLSLGLYRRGLLGQPTQIVKTSLGQGDLANFTVDNIAETLRNHGYGDTLGEKGQEALDNHFDARQGNAEAIQDHVNGEDMMSLSLQTSSKIALDEKIRAKWFPAHQPYQSKRSQVSKSSPKEALECLLRRRQFNRQSIRDGEKKFAMSAVNRKIRPMTRQVVLVITFTPSLTVRSPRQRQSWKVSTNTTWCSRLMTS